MKKPALLIALGRGPTNKMDDDEEGQASDYAAEKKALAADVMAAIKEGNKAALADALEAFVLACSE
jgi:hypothetical protein